MARKGGRSRGRGRGRELVKAVTGGGLAPRARAGGAQTLSLDAAVQALTGAALKPEGTFAPVVDYPRDPLDTSPFGPLWPLHVQAINPPREDTGQPEPRVWEYPTGFNLPGSGNRLLDWGVLRQASTSVDVIRRCIEIRKDDVRTLKWSWTISEDAIKAAQEAEPTKPRDEIEAALRKEHAADIKRLTAFWERPWITNGVRFGQWVAAVMEDHIVLDAVAIYPVTTVGGDVVAFRVVDGSTIKLLINADGERPQPPFAAFQQVLEGFPRGEYLSDVVLNADGTEDTSPAFTARQITYWRENFRTYTPYGLSQVEQALVSAALYLKRQGWMHAEYDEGSTPLTWLIPQGDKFVANQLGPAQRREYESAINDDLEGQTGKRHRIKMSYPGYEPQQMDSVDERYKPEYDRYLVGMVIGHMGVTMDRFGLTETKGLGATGQHERMAEVQDDSGVNPDARMITDLVLELSRNYLSAPLELTFTLSKDKVEDEAAKSTVLDQQRKRGAITLNEDRKASGLQPLAIAEADMPSMVTATGVVYLEGGAQKQAEMDAAAVELAKNPPVPGAPGATGGGKPSGGGSGGTGGSRPKPTGPKPAGPTNKMVMPDEAVAQRTELRAYGRWFKALGPRVPARPFRFGACEPETLLAAGHEPDGRYMAFDGYEWRADITKDWRSWNAAHPLHPRGPHGRFVKIGNLVDELRRAHGPLSSRHEDALDEATRRVHAGKPFKRGERSEVDELERRGLLEEHGGAGGNKGFLELSEAGRLHLRRRGPDDIAPEHVPAGVPEPVNADDDVHLIGEGYGDFGPSEDVDAALPVANPEPVALMPEEVALHEARERHDDTMGALSAAVRGRREDDARAARDPQFRQERADRIAESLGLLGGMAGALGDDDAAAVAHTNAVLRDTPLAVQTPAVAVLEGEVVEDARRQSPADRLRQAEIMYGSDRSAWPAHAKRDAARLERLAARDQRRGIESGESPTSGGQPTESTGRVSSMTTSVVEYNGETFQRSTKGPAYTHASVVQWSDGTREVASWHTSEAAASRGTLTAQQRRNGAQVVDVLQVRTKGDLSEPMTDINPGAPHDFSDRRSKSDVQPTDNPGTVTGMSEDLSKLSVTEVAERLTAARKPLPKSGPERKRAQAERAAIIAERDRRAAQGRAVASGMVDELMAAAPAKRRVATEAREEEAARQARQAANMAAQRERNGGETDFERGIRRQGAADRRSGDAEYRRVETTLDAEQRTLTVKQRELASVEQKLSSITSGAQYDRLTDARDALLDDIGDLEQRMAPMRARLEEIKRGDIRPKRHNKAAGSTDAKADDPKA